MQKNNTVFKAIIRPVERELRAFENAYLKQFHIESLLLQPLLHGIGEDRGKRLRPITFFLVQGLVGSSKLEGIDVAVLLEMLHTATLIHDDVVDQSLTRRGKETVNARWGDRVSVLAGDYIFAKVLSLGVNMPWREVLEVVSRVVSDMGKGELRQALSGALDRMTEASYYQIVNEKTAGLFRAACELACIVAGTSPEIKERACTFGLYFGTSFQIRDDILDFTGSEEMTGKPIGQDPQNGNVTLPLILAMAGTSKQQRMEVLHRIENGSSEDSEWIDGFVEEHGGVEKAQKKAEDFSRKAISVLNDFPESRFRVSLEQLILYDLERPG